MKKILLILILASYWFSNAQIVNIPDTNFKNALLNHNPVIDTNSDGEIQVSEAENTVTLGLGNKNISSLIGIEDFINLTYLYCNNNNLNTINLSNNVALINLNCINNNLSTLNLNNNIALTELNCSNNQIESLNLVDNISLDIINCNNNVLTTLLVNTNINNNTSFTWLECAFNQLTNLDVSNIDFVSSEGLDCSNNNLTNLIMNNTDADIIRCNNNQFFNLDFSDMLNLSHLSCSDNPFLNYINLKNGNNNNFYLQYSDFENLPNLQTVCVDDVSTDLTDFILNETGHDVEFITNCATANILENTLLDFSIYPIPTTGVLNIKSKTEITKIDVFNKLGQLVLSDNNSNIDISNLNQGFYYCKVEDTHGNFGIKKVIKK